MLKKFLLFLLILALCCAGGVYFALPPLIENAVRDNLAGLPASLNRPGERIFEAPAIGSVKFEFPARRLKVEKASLRGEIIDPSLGKVKMVCRIGEIEGVLPWRLLFLLSPFQGMISSPFGFETVLTSFTGKDASLSLDSEVLQAENALSGIEGEEIALEGNLLGSLLNQLPLDALDFLYGCGIARLRLTDFNGNVSNPATRHILTHKLGAASLEGWRGRKAKSVAFENLSLSSPSENILSLDRLALADITLPEMPLLVALQTEALNRNPFGVSENLREIFRGAPLAGRLELNGFSSKDFSIRVALARWASSRPLAGNFSAEDIVIPANVIGHETGVFLKGLNEIRLNLNASAEENGAQKMAYKGSAHAAELGAFAWSCNAPEAPESLFGLLSAEISDFNLDYTDDGLAARLAASITSNPQAAMFALKIAAAKVCAGAGPENAALRETLESFIERPGTLNVRARKPFTLAQIGVQSYMGDLGTIFAASAKPGARSLDEEIRALYR